MFFQRSSFGSCLSLYRASSIRLPSANVRLVIGHRKFDALAPNFTQKQSLSTTLKAFKETKDDEGSRLDKLGLIKPASDVQPQDQTSFNSGRVPLAKIFGSGDDGKTDRKMLLSFTCKVCSSRSTNFISRLVIFALFSLAFGRSL